MKTEEQKARHRAAVKKYRKSPKGKAKVAAYRASPKAVAAQAARRSTPEYKAQASAYNRRYNSTPERKAARAAHHLRNRYGIAPEDRDQMIEDQDGKCKICGDKLDMGKFTHVDHCHVSGKVRGVLCLACNNGIERFKDSVDIMEKAIQYLQQSG